MNIMRFNSVGNIFDPIVIIDYLEHWQGQIKQHRSLLKEHDELFARKAEIERDYGLFIETRKLGENFAELLDPR